MILSILMVVVVGVVAGAGTDELLRGRAVRSRVVIAAALAGAIAGSIVRHAMGDDGALIDALTALLGAGLVASVTRVRMSAILERGHASVVLIETGEVGSTMRRIPPDISAGGNS